MLPNEIEEYGKEIGSDESDATSEEDEEMSDVHSEEGSSSRIVEDVQAENQEDDEIEYDNEEYKKKLKSVLNDIINEEEYQLGIFTKS